MLKAKKLSLSTKSLRYVLKISFALTFAIPILALLYIFSDYIPLLATKHINFTFIVVISVAVAYGGFLLIKQIIDPLIKMSSEVRLIANGDFSRRIDVGREDELGELGEALNEITAKVKDNMQQLNVFGQEAQRANVQIQNRILVLSGILQISNLITQGIVLDDILGSAVEKTLAIPNCECSFIFLRDDKKNSYFKISFVSGKYSQELLNKEVILEENDIGRLFLRMLDAKVSLVLDASRKKVTREEEALLKELKLRNVLLVPIVIKHEIKGFLGIGNNIEDFFFNQETADFLNIFSRQISIAIENDALVHKVKQLETRDALTGLYNEDFIRSYLDDEIKRAIMFQRPCSFLGIDISNFKNYKEKFGDISGEKALKKIALIIKDELTAVDRAGRFGSGSFAIVVPEKNKKQAKDKAIKLKRLLDSLLAEDKEIQSPLVLNIVITENPLDGASANELISKANNSLQDVKDSGGVVID